MVPSGYNWPPMDKESVALTNELKAQLNVTMLRQGFIRLADQLHINNYRRNNGTVIKNRNRAAKLNKKALRKGFRKNSWGIRPE